MNRPDLRTQSSPEALRAALTARRDELRGAGHVHPPAQESVRRLEHRGHEIVVRTSYSISVDGRPFDARPSVNNAGLVHYHGLPTQDFPSVMDLVTRAIDTYPDDFPGEAPAPASPHGSHTGRARP